jgi:hypothetical protein
LWALACSSEQPELQRGGDTHWLAACDEDGDCGRGSCTCGVCTESCSGDEQCAGGPAAQCYTTASPGVRAACSSGSAPDADARGICLAQCSPDGECGDGLRCLDGACVQDLPPPASGPDASDEGSAAMRLPAARPSDFAELQSTVSFDEPAPFFEPERFFFGPAEGLLGTWTEPNCDPTDPDTWSLGDGCVTLVIERSGPNGEIGGQLRLRNEFDFSPWRINWQEFAPPVDPDIGYPVEIEPKDYTQLAESSLFGPYTLLDPTFDGTRLQFWFTAMELWDGWCKLQTSYRVPGGDPPYQCVPEGAAYGDPEVDFGKLVLCTSEWSTGTCDVNCGQQGPGCKVTSPTGCSCWSEPGVRSDRPECSPANCHCDEHGCQANWPEYRANVAITVDGERMTVREGFNPKRAGAAMGVLQRQAAP